MLMHKELFPVIEAAGSPYEIGVKHGSLGKVKIDATMNTYKSMFKDYSQIEWEDAKRYALTFIPTITEYDPTIMEEIQGIADGSGYELADILALNVRSEIVLQGSQVSSANSDGCTSFGFTPRVTADGNTWVGQNWDWKLTQQKGCIILHIKQQDKPNITMVTEAGIVGKIGFNSAGIGVCLNALASSQKVAGKVVPLHIALRGILNSFTLSDAINAVGRMNLSCCANFMMASAEGQAVSVEVGPGDIDVLYANEGWVTHTNHFVGPRMINVKDTGRIYLPDSYLRLGRIRDIIQMHDGKIGLKDIQDILKDHVGYPDSICRHEDALEPEGKRLGTVFSIIMNLDREEMYFAPGTPCNCSYHLYKI